MAELEFALDAEQKTNMETYKDVKKNERRVRELTTELEEEKRNNLRSQDAINHLEAKIKSYKKQVEETEEIAATNLAKYRKAHLSLNDAADRADQAETDLNRQRAYNRSSVSMARE